ncbi:MAG: phosphopyruvate hydratase [Patescibacteria group bacterium]|nr:phosphopyruvate hydratase [Patescibacteria group bacterium]
MAKIRKVEAREILNSKGDAAIETSVLLGDNSIGISSCPAGTSVGDYEALSLDAAKAIENVNKIIGPEIIGMESLNQQEVDKKMITLDGTQNKSRLGANAILSVSMALAKASARSSVLPLFLYLRQFIKKDKTIKIPTPIFNIIGGGRHADNSLNFQEFLIIPASSKPYKESLTIGNTIYKFTKDILKENQASTLVGLEGAYGPNLATNQEALAILKSAVDRSDYRFDFDVFFGIDAAANNFRSSQGYLISDKRMNLAPNELVTFYKELNSNYHLLYLEDPLSQDDWEGWQRISQDLSENSLIVGDDIIATNPYRLQVALDKKAVTGIIIKPNQIGTVIEALAVVEVARQTGLKVIVSHRSGETNDDFIADFAVAVSADYVKFGPPARGERVAKYNRLSQIESQLKLI